MNIGGTHIKKELDPLDKDIKNWMDGAKNGVIVVSFGSVRLSLGEESSILNQF